MRFISSRYYMIMSCVRYFFFHSSKTNDETLVIEVENKSGEISFELINRITNESKLILNPISGTYKLPLKLNEKYKLIIKAKHTSGHYKIYKEKK